MMTSQKNNVDCISGKRVENLPAFPEKSRKILPATLTGTRLEADGGVICTDRPLGGPLCSSGIFSLKKSAV
jgi:hypothetical protein